MAAVTGNSSGSSVSRHRPIRSSKEPGSSSSLRMFPSTSLEASLRRPAALRWCSLSAIRSSLLMQRSAARLCHLLRSSSLPVSTNLLFASSFRTRSPFPSNMSPWGTWSRSFLAAVWRRTHSMPTASLSSGGRPRIMSELMRLTVGGVDSSESGTPDARRSDRSLSVLSLPRAVRKYTLRLTLQLDPFMRDRPMATSPFFSRRSSTVHAWARVIPAAAATPSCVISIGAPNSIPGSRWLYLARWRQMSWRTLKSYMHVRPPSSSIPLSRRK